MIEALGGVIINQLLPMVTPDIVRSAVGPITSLLPSGTLETVMGFALTVLVCARYAYYVLWGIKKMLMGLNGLLAQMFGVAKETETKADDQAIAWAQTKVGWVLGWVDKALAYVAKITEAVASVAGASPGMKKRVEALMKR